MIEREAARALAQKAVGDRQLIEPDRYTETREGWYFPYARRSEMMVGSNGVIVHKRSGRAFVLGSAFPTERDIKAFDEGFQFDLYDLVILEISDRPRTVATLVEVGPTITIPEYKDGTVWKIPRPLTEDEIAQRLDRLPAVFSDISLYFRIEVLQKARDRGYFRFVALHARRWLPANPPLQRTKLGKHKMGKSWLYFKQLADLDKSVLEQLVAGSVAEVRRRYG